METERGRGSMRKLRLVGLSSDGRQVVCVDDAGTEFALPADDRLRAALRGDRARLGQLEIQMDSALRPRDIQARIRAGESPEAVATLAGVSVDKIMPFCVPVIAERQHVAETARRSHVRRKNAEGPARRLADVVAERLRGRGLDPESAEWDAWRRDDGRWTVTATYMSGERERAGNFVFDMAGRYSVADDDEAKWLTGEKQSSSHGPQPRTARAGERRLSAVPDGDDLLSLSTDEAATGDDLDAVMRAVQEEDAASVEVTGSEGEVTEAAEVAEVADATEATESPDVDLTPSDEPELARHEKAAAAKATAATDMPDLDEAEDAEQEDAQETDQAEPTKRATEPTPRKRKQRRASVPSWDEIMFGKNGSSD
jgi:Protein of unknown function (DUF3071)